MCAYDSSLQLCCHSTLGLDVKTVAAPSLPLAVIPFQRNNCSSVPYVRTSSQDANFGIK
jgi:hypothetical protein